MSESQQVSPLIADVITNLESVVSNRFYLRGRPFKLASYQASFIRKVLERKERRFVFVACTRTGKTESTSILACLLALLYDWEEIVVIANEFPQAEKLFRNIKEYVFSNAELYQYVDQTKPFRLNEMNFVNGSIIRCMTAANTESALGFGATVLIIDEASSIPDQVYRTRILRMMAGTGGRQAPIIILLGTPHCVAPDTLIIRDGKIGPIGVLPEGEAPVDAFVYGGGQHKAIGTYGIVEPIPALTITTKRGLMLTASHNHRIMLENGRWKRLDKLTIGDRIRIERGMNVFGKDWCDSEWAYLMGLFLGDGNYESWKGKLDGLCITCPSKDVEIIGLLVGHGFNCHDGIHWRLHSRTIAKEVCGLEFTHIKARIKTVPNWVGGLDREGQAAFISGLFDAEGSVTERGYIELTSASRKLIATIQIMLLNFGITSYINGPFIRKPSKKAKVESTMFTLNIRDSYSAKLFYSNIGFKLKRKQVGIEAVKGALFYRDNLLVPYKMMKRLSGGFGKGWHKGKDSKYEYETIKEIADSNPKNRYFKRLISTHYLIDEINEIKEVTSDLYDYYIPDGHRYFTNGFISHNTMNFMYDAFCSDDFYKQKVTWKDGVEAGILNMEVVMQAKKTMTDNEFRMWYEAEFVSGGGTLFDSRKVQSLAIAKPQETPDEHYDYFMGVDVARLGNDESAVVVMRLPHGAMWDETIIEMVNSYTRGKRGVADTIGWVSTLIDKWSPIGVAVDEIGLGAGVFDMLTEKYGEKIRGIQTVGEERTQIYMALQDLVETERVLLLNDDKLKEQLKTYSVEYTSTSKLKIAKKEDAHDDLSDATCFCAYIIRQFREETITFFDTMAKSTFFGPASANPLPNSPFGSL